MSDPHVREIGRLMDDEGRVVIVGVDHGAVTLRTLHTRTSDAASERCPATTRYTPAHSVTTYGLQCRFARGHDGDHCGEAGIADSDYFWPQEIAAGTDDGGAVALGMAQQEELALLLVSATRQAGAYQGGAP